MRTSNLKQLCNYGKKFFSPDTVVNAFIWESSHRKLNTISERWTYLTELPFYFIAAFVRYLFMDPKHKLVLVSSIKFSLTFLKFPGAHTYSCCAHNNSQKTTHYWSQCSTKAFICQYTSGVWYALVIRTYNDLRTTILIQG